jgi:hypothetical protein
VKLESYRQVQRAVAAAIGIIVAVSVVRNNVSPIVAVTVGMLILYLATRITGNEPQRGLSNPTESGSATYQ